MKDRIIGVLGLVLCVLSFVNFGEYLKSNSHTIFAVWLQPILSIVLVAVGIILMMDAKWIEE